MNDKRLSDLKQFYLLLDALEKKIGGPRLLSACAGKMEWPRRGVYFFMEADERRLESGSGRRVVRVGTHAITSSSKSKLWTRLSQHRGTFKAGGGNHRGSIFRLIVGTAVIARDTRYFPTWGIGGNAPSETRAAEQDLEYEVSILIGSMPFLWLAIDDAPAVESLRGDIERNAIALLSNFDKHPLDAPSASWLGRFCNRERVRKSGLWNQNHVDESYDPTFLDRLGTVISEMGSA